MPIPMMSQEPSSSSAAIPLMRWVLWTLREFQSPGRGCGCPNPSADSAESRVVDSVVRRLNLLVCAKGRARNGDPPSAIALVVGTQVSQLVEPAHGQFHY